MLFCAHHILLGRFRLLDNGNTPKGPNEAGNLARIRPDLRPNLKLLADVAYQGDSMCRCPYRNPQLTVGAAGSREEAARRRLYNQRLSSSRQRVEHAFSRLKRMFAVLHGTWNLELDQLSKAMRAAALLCNWIGRTRGLYKEDHD